MTLPPRELLSSDLREDGLWQARYPSASRTLCGRPAVDDRRHGRRYPPTCGVCGKTARKFDRIDGAMPNHWRKAR